MKYADTYLQSAEKLRNGLRYAKNCDLNYNENRKVGNTKRACCIQKAYENQQLSKEMSS